MPIRIDVASHPALELGAFVTRYDRPLADTTAPDAVVRLIGPSAEVGAPFSAGDAVRTIVRDLLRAGGFKPSGRSKPASEYLAAAIVEGRFPRINAAVDACNVVSLHSGLPISLIDLDRANAPAGFRVACAPAETSYVFNPSGQVIDASHLLCVFDAEGPTGTPVKDAQRTKTHDGTRATLAVVWGSRALPAGTTAAVTRWYRELSAMSEGVVVEDVDVVGA